MTIVPYHSQYHQACLRIFQSNLPGYFDESELRLLEQWLHGLDDSVSPPLVSAAHHFFVMEEKGAIVGCGGFYVTEGKPEAHLVWGMVDRRFHKRGGGTKLLKFRLDEIQRRYPGHSVFLDTSQHTFRFFERLGFKVTRIILNGYGIGLDRYDMERS